MTLKKLLEGDYIMSLLDWFRSGQKELYEIHCPLCGKWVCDTNMKVGIIIQPCRECKKKLVILNYGDGPLVFMDMMRKKEAYAKANL